MNVGQPAYEQIRDILREEIISGKIPPDTHLIKADIADRFGVSQMPVREALQWLKGEGLISGRAHRGYRVISIDENFIRHIFEIRTAMEELMARRSISLITQTDIQRLNKINDQLSAIGDRKNVEKIQALDKSFHRTLYRHCDNPISSEIYEKYRALVASLRKRHGFGPERLPKLVEEHSAIVDALIKKNETGLEKLIRKHRTDAMKDLLQQFIK
jgi:DNA-binding GntR family transcriptional regulator